MSTHTMELEAYSNYVQFCERIGVLPLPLKNWRRVTASIPSGWGTVARDKRHNPGYSVLNPQSRIAVSA